MHLPPTLLQLFSHEERPSDDSSLAIDRHERLVVTLPLIYSGLDERLEACHSTAAVETTFLASSLRYPFHPMFKCQALQAATAVTVDSLCGHFRVGKAQPEVGQALDEFKSGFSQARQVAVRLDCRRAKSLQRQQSVALAALNLRPQMSRGCERGSLQRATVSARELQVGSTLEAPSWSPWLDGFVLHCIARPITALQLHHCQTFWRIAAFSYRMALRYSPISLSGEPNLHADVGSARVRCSAPNGSTPSSTGQRTRISSRLFPPPSGTPSAPD